MFKLADLVKLYSSRLEHLYQGTSYNVNSTRIKERLLKLIPALWAETHGRDILLIFENYIGDAIHIACTENDSDSVYLMRTAKAIRKEIFSSTYAFKGTFESGCEENVVPPTLQVLMNMIMNGPNIECQAGINKQRERIALSISELVMFNTTHSSSHIQNSPVRHNRERETPLPIYLALMVHAKTQKRSLVDKLHNLGLSISYNRLMSISSALGNSVCAKFMEDKVVCPPKAKKELFTVGCMDNIDHNPSSRTAQDSFHGTAISLIQFPTTECPGTNQGIAFINPEDPSFREISKLPPTYTTVSAIALPCSSVKVPLQNGSLFPSTDISIQSITREWDWLKHADQLNRVATMGATDCMSWATFQATQQTPRDRHLASISLLPLFNENAHSPAMVFHAMKVAEQAVTFLNPGQTPVMAMDQPLSALAKQLQWKYRDDVGEEKYVIMMGGLHLEMGMYRIIGQYLSGSGWTSALVKSEITTSGQTDEIEKGVNVTRARYAHEVIATALFLLQKESYDEYVLSIRPPNEPLSFQELFKKESKDHPQFLYWSIALELELKVLQFVRSIPEGDFVLY